MKPTQRSSTQPPPNSGPAPSSDIPYIQIRAIERELHQPREDISKRCEDILQRSKESEQMFAEIKEKMKKLREDIDKHGENLRKLDEAEERALLFPMTWEEIFGGYAENEVPVGGKEEMGMRDGLVMGKNEEKTETREGEIQEVQKGTKRKGEEMGGRWGSDTINGREEGGAKRLCW